jgi:hypothetical protein
MLWVPDCVPVVLTAAPPGEAEIWNAPVVKPVAMM